MLPWGDALRPGWFSTLHEVTGSPKQKEGIRGWVANRQFQIYDAPTPTAFVLSYADEAVVCDAFAAEVSRFSRAAAESSFTITESSRLPTSRAWQVIQWYYAAYFAAHSLLRMFGQSLTYLERGHVRAINEVAQAYGFINTVIAPGFYFVDAVRGRHGAGLQFRQFTHSKGSHDELWRTFTLLVEAKSRDVLTNQMIASRDAQDISRHLTDLAQMLRAQPHSDGTWMAAVRNEVTYRHTRSAWHPWRPPHRLPSLHERRPEHLRDVCSALTAAMQAPCELSRLRYLAHALLALCRVNCNEMQRRCPRGRSFQAGGLAALDSLVAQH